MENLSSFSRHSPALPRGLFVLQPTLIFHFSEENLAWALHITELSPQRHIPLVPCVPKRQQDAVKRAYNLGPVGPEPVIPLLCNPEDPCRVAQASLFIHPNSCPVRPWMVNHHCLQLMGSRLLPAVRGDWFKMADQKDVCSPSVRAPKLQLAAEQPLAGDTGTH